MTDIATSGRVQHVYDFATLDRVPDGPTSLKVTAKRLLSGPTLQTGKSSTVGAVLAGSHIITTLGRSGVGVYHAYFQELPHRDEQGYIDYWRRASMITGLSAHQLLSLEHGYEFGDSEATNYDPHFLAIGLALRQLVEEG